VKKQASYEGGDGNIQPLRVQYPFLNLISGLQQKCGVLTRVVPLCGAGFTVSMPNSK
jgi:hypothetical protein